MRLQEFISSVFPGLSRSKSEKIHIRGSQDQRNLKPGSKSFSIQSPPLSPHSLTFYPREQGQRNRKSSFPGDKGDHPLEFLACFTDVVDHERLIQPKKSKEQSRSGNTLDSPSGDGELDDLESDDSRTSGSITRSRTKIRTNPWLASPPPHTPHPLQHRDANGTFQISMSSHSEPATPSRDSSTWVSGPAIQIPDHVVSGSVPIGRKELGLVLDTRGNAYDSGSEGYATSLYRSPSLTDLDCVSVDGGIDSALASSVSCESELDQLDHFAFDADRSHQEENATGLSNLASDGDTYTSSPNGVRVKINVVLNDEDLLLGKEGVVEESVSASSGELISELQSLGDHGVLVEAQAGETRLENAMIEPELASEGSQGHRNCRSDCNTSGDDLLKPIEDSSVNHETEAEKCFPNEPEEFDLGPSGAYHGISLSRSLNDLSRSLQEKVEHLHEQKIHVDAVFRKAREADEHRAWQFAKFRSQFIIAKRQTMLQKLKELQALLGCQSTRLQTVYDAILSKQWPSVFGVSTTEQAE